MTLSVLFLAKANDSRSIVAAEYLRAMGCNLQCHFGSWGDPFPSLAQSWRGDIIVSYLSRWVVPQKLLDNAKTAINFHPAPPEYPGVGGVNWALYEQAKSFGVTCHHMAARVDTGPVIAVRRFSTFPLDTVSSLSERAWTHQLVLFYEIMPTVIVGAPLPKSSEQWNGRVRSRKEFNALCVVDLASDPADALRRIRATTYDPYFPVLSIGDRRFTIKEQITCAREP